jgi:hypothetical protein
VRAHTIEFADIDNMSRAILQLWAQDATFCAAQATEYFSAVATLRAADNIGFLVSEIYAIATAARAAAGFSVVALLENHIRANEAIVARLWPTCQDTPLWGDAPPGYGPVEVLIRCTAYNGDVGYDSVIVNARRGDPLPPIDHTYAENQATARTSRAVALDALPKLRNALADA